MRDSLVEPWVVLTLQQVVRAMDILSRHCLSSKPVPFQILSDQSINFTAGYGSKPEHDPSCDMLTDDLRKAPMEGLASPDVSGPPKGLGPSQ